jgi:TolA-binding protein
MKKLTLIWLILTCSLLANEPSAFGAGNLDSKKPYGLTPSEKNILKNREKVENLSEGVGSVKMRLSKMDEDYEGLRSVVEGFGSRLSRMNQQIRDTQESIKEKDKSIASLQQEVVDLKIYINETRTIQDENQDRIKLVLSELSSLIDSINNNYVSKESFAKLEAQVKKHKTSKIISSLSGKSGSILLKEGVALFDKKSFDEAKLRFTKLVKMNFKPARSNFYLGEIAYFQERFKTAIEHYKKSISLYDKADYMPTLLYHTGVSFSKLNNHEQSAQFFNALKQGYPNSKEAKSLN